MGSGDQIHLPNAPWSPAMPSEETARKGSPLAEKPSAARSSSGMLGLSRIASKVAVLLRETVDGTSPRAPNRTVQSTSGQILGLRVVLAQQRSS